MSAKKGGQHRKRARGRRRSAAAAAGALLLVPVVAAGEPAPWNGQETEGIALAGHVGGGLGGLTDPSEVGVDGSLPETISVDEEILALNGRLTGVPGSGSTAGPAVPLGPSGPLGIPGNMLSAYMRAANTVNAATPGCNLTWPLLASIGRIESNHARGGAVDANGTTARPILGPVLNGNGFAAIRDTDGGAWDGDRVWDRAVGPMQFIPSTWKGYAADGNGDGEKNPNNIYDATVGAGKYLCSGGMNLANPQQLRTAVWRYNHSDSYVRTVITWAESYARGVTPLPSSPPSGGGYTSGGYTSGGSNSGGTTPGGSTGGTAPGTTQPPATTDPSTPPPTTPPVEQPPAADPNSTATATSAPRPPASAWPTETTEPPVTCEPVEEPVDGTTTTPVPTTTTSPDATELPPCEEEGAESAETSPEGVDAAAQAAVPSATRSAVPS